MRRYSNPRCWVSDLGGLVAPPTHRNTTELETRPPAQRQRRQRCRGKLDDEQLRYAAALRFNGDFPSIIAGELGVSEETVRRALRRQGGVSLE